MEKAIIKTSKVVVYKSREDKEITEAQIQALRENWKAIEYNGFMSEETKKKLSRKLSSWSRSIEIGNKYTKSNERNYIRKILFLTLTLPFDQTTTDVHIKRYLLTPFIAYLKTTNKINYYFWKAEAQSNGNIHFHILIDKYIDKNEINRAWNSFCSSYYTKQTGQTRESIKNAPSTKIEAPKNGDSIENYVLKYALKEDSHRKINGRIWGMSDELREIDVPIFEMSDEIAKCITDLDKVKKITIIQGDYFRIYEVDLIDENNYIGSKFQDEIIIHYLDIYDKLYNTNKTNKQ